MMHLSHQYWIKSQYKCSISNQQRNRVRIFAEPVYIMRPFAGLPEKTLGFNELTKRVLLIILGAKVKLIPMNEIHETVQVQDDKEGLP
ncbi:TPA: hypothetical protein JLM99_004182 [Escherichia coli]|nr:hypothetical protein [Escherichia coli]